MAVNRRGHWSDCTVSFSDGDDVAVILVGGEMIARRRSLESCIGIQNVRRYAALLMTLGPQALGGQAENNYRANVNGRKRQPFLSDALSPNPGGSLFVHQY